MESVAKGWPNNYKRKQNQYYCAFFNLQALLLQVFSSLPFCLYLFHIFLVNSSWLRWEERFAVPTQKLSDGERLHPKAALTLWRPQGNSRAENYYLLGEIAPLYILVRERRAQCVSALTRFNHTLCTTPKMTTYYEAVLMDKASFLNHLIKHACGKMLFFPEWSVFSRR